MDGHWEYGIRDEDGEVFASHSSWHWEPFHTADQARKSGFEGVVMRRWIPEGGQWQEVRDV